MKEERDALREKEPGFALFEDFQPLWLAIDAEINKWLLSKDQIQGTLIKGYSGSKNSV